MPGFLRLRDDRIHKVKEGDIVINWGVGTKSGAPITLNVHQAVKLATDKLQAFYALEAENVAVVPFTEDVEEVLDWCVKGYTVVKRNKLTGHSGDGIVIIEKGECSSLACLMKEPAPLYTKYIFKKKEYRVHVVNGQVVDTQQKIRDPKLEVKTWKVRSHANGFLFAREGITQSPVRDDLAIRATKAIGLDFGAVDIIEDKFGNFYVLEINTAPGLEGQTVTNYAKAFANAAQG